MCHPCCQCSREKRKVRWWKEEERVVASPFRVKSKLVIYSDFFEKYQEEHVQKALKFRVIFFTCICVYFLKERIQ
jgi:hypothetical protein